MIYKAPEPVMNGIGKNRKEWDPTKSNSSKKYEPREQRELQTEKSFSKSTEWNNGRD